jgi:hypothetical protein
MRVRKTHGTDKRTRVAWGSLSADAHRFLNDLLTMPKYHGGLQSNATQNELSRLGLIDVIYGYKTDASGVPRDFVKLTAKGKRLDKDADVKAWRDDPLGWTPGKSGGKKRHARGSRIGSLARDVEKMIR